MTTDQPKIGKNMMDKLKKCPKCGHEGGLIHCPSCHTRQVEFQPERWKAFDSAERAHICLALTMLAVNTYHEDGDEKDDEVTARTIEMTCQLVSEINMSVGLRGVNNELLASAVAKIRTRRKSGNGEAFGTGPTV